MYSYINKVAPTATSFPSFSLSLSIKKETFSFYDLELKL